jgi:hypothetical protein
VPFQAATDLAHAWEHLGAADMGRTISGRLGGGPMDPQLEAVFGQPWNVLEVAAAGLSSGQVMSAIDLCADAVLLTCGEPLQGSGRFYDLGELRKRRRRLAAAPGLRAWIDQLLAHPDLAELEDCRHHLTHRTPRRHITYRVDGRGTPTVRELAEITTLHGVKPPQWRGSIAELVPRMVAFGEEQLEALCTAILTPRRTA